MIFRTLLAHYRRHPGQALFLLTGIIIANVLLAGTLLINAQARASYGKGEQFLSGTPVATIRHKDRNKTINEIDYVQLRRQGFDMLAPLLRQFVRTQDGQALELMGVDVFAIPRSNTTIKFNQRPEANGNNPMGLAFPPYQLWVAPARLKQLGAKTGEQLQLNSGEKLPPLVTMTNQQLGHRMLMDIGELQRVTSNTGKLSSILVFPASNEQFAQLQKVLPAQLEFFSNIDAPDPAELTRSFHLNLAAMGLLAFVVGIFLTYNALAFSYTDRRDLIRKLLLAGVLKTQMIRALLLELSLFLAVGLLIGSFLGAQIAALLLPGVGQTLAQLYGVYIAYPDGLAPSGIWLPLLMTVISAGFCVFFPLRKTLNTPLLDRRQAGWQQLSVLRRDKQLALTGLLLLTVASLLGYSADSLPVALSGMAALLLGAALLLPMVLRILISALEKLVPPRSPRLSWLLADSRWLLGPASLALMALTMALVANSGLNTMISSFREATDNWMNQRLAADLYLRGTHNISELEDWLTEYKTGLKVSERFRTGITRPAPSGTQVSVEVVSLQDDERFLQGVELIQSEDDAKAQFGSGNGIYISERAWRIDGWETGLTLKLCNNRPEVPILGIYHDYGNPKSQWMVSRQLFLNCWPEQIATSLAVYGPENMDWSNVRAAMSERFGLKEDEIINQYDLKQVGLTVFDRTFAVTRALNALTLLVAAIGIFCAISAIHHHRVAQQALLASLGMTRLERGVLLLLQWGILGLLCMVLVWPFGTALAAYLATVVTPVAFGWSFPLTIEWSHYLVLAALAACSLVLAVLLPSLRLLGTSPAAMLREQNI